MTNFAILLASLALVCSVLAQKPQFDIEERLSVLESRIGVLSSRVLSLEYEFKDYVSTAAAATTPASQKHRQPNPVAASSSNHAVEIGHLPVVPDHVDDGGFRPRDCSQIKEELNSQQRHSTFYTIYPITRTRPVEVFCDMETYGGGWTVVQSRGFEGDVREDFNRTWKEYEKGFGKMNGDYWLGLSNFAALTKYDDQEVLYEFLQINADGKRIVSSLRYDKFMVENAENFYRLHLGGFNAQYSTALTYYLENQSGVSFSTRDKDNAGTNNRNCRHNSGWWLQSTICHRQPDLNMPYDDEGILHLHRYNTVQDKHGVSIKIRAKEILAV